MFEHFTKKDRRSNIEKAVDRVLEEMDKVSPASKEYTMMAENLETLRKAEAQKAILTPDGILHASVYLAGLVIVLNFEKLDIIRSKAFGQLMKIRL